jgi:hypothetical protein
MASTRGFGFKNINSGAYSLGQGVPKTIFDRGGQVCRIIRVDYNDLLGRDAGARKEMKKKYPGIFLAIILFICSAFLGMNSATALMLEMSPTELTQQAESIVRGKVKDMKSEWDPERRFIWTLVTISVSHSIKGNSPEKQDVVVKIPGGEVGDIGQKTEDTPTFTKGEEVLLFLQPVVYREKKVFRVTGNFQGKHTIKDNMLIEKNMPVETFLGQIEKAK